MAKFTLVDAYLAVGAGPTNLSTHVRSVTLNYGAEIKDATCMGAGQTKAKMPGFIDWSIDVEFAQDFAASLVDATLSPLVGAAAFNIHVKPTSAAASATNPEFWGTALLESYTPISGAVGDLATATVTFQGSGVLTRATS